MQVGDFWIVAVAVKGRLDGQWTQYTISALVACHRANGHRLHLEEILSAPELNNRKASNANKSSWWHKFYGRFITLTYD